jgi:hypothetical protein
MRINDLWLFWGNDFSVKTTLCLAFGLFQPTTIWLNAA